jgi:hypothetical protein
MRGITYESWWNGEFLSDESDLTLRTIVVPTGANWLAIVVKCFQTSRTSVEIRCLTDQGTATDDELRHVIHRAHDLGLKVMLKPHVDLLDLENSSSGRFAISFGADETAWDAWFNSYTVFITHYATLAQENGVEYFTVGTELWGTVHRAQQWRDVIRAVRAVYEGPLTYAALTYLEPLQITWWNELDAIGIDAYFLLTLTNTPTVSQMELGWSSAFAFLELLSRQWDKPIIITEVGYMSVDGTNISPGNWSLEGNIDLQEQADAYMALFRSFEEQDWWHGMFLWSLSTDPNQGGPLDRGYSFHNKPAEAVIQAFFNRQNTVQPLCADPRHLCSQ